MSTSFDWVIFLSIPGTMYWLTELVMSARSPMSHASRAGEAAAAVASCVALDCPSAGLVLGASDDECAMTIDTTSSRTAVAVPISDYTPWFGKPFRYSA